MPSSSRVTYWVVLVMCDAPRLIRLALFVAGVFFLFTESWYAGFGCFAVLLWWKANLIQARLEEIRNVLRGFTDDEWLEAIKSGETMHPNQKGQAERDHHPPAGHQELPDGTTGATLIAAPKRTTPTAVSKHTIPSNVSTSPALWILSMCP